MRQDVLCPSCGHIVTTYRCPMPTVDIVIQLPGQRVVLIKRANQPSGWALPGGFVDLGETVEAAAVREAKEETGLDVELSGLLGVYSDPARDPRQHTVSVVYIGIAVNPRSMAAGGDASQTAAFPFGSWPEPLAFDHYRILDDFLCRVPHLSR